MQVGVVAQYGVGVLVSRRRRVISRHWIGSLPPNDASRSALRLRGDVLLVMDDAHPPRSIAPRPAPTVSSLSSSTQLSWI